MNRIIVSTNIRNVSADETSGNLYIIDLDDQKILQKTSGIEVPDRKYDANPRGGMRGMRGLGICNSELAAAIYSSILVFDSHWNLIRSITHPSVAAIHEIDYSELGLWVASTANDTLVRFDQSGALQDLLYLPDQPGLKKLTGSTNPPLKTAQLKTAAQDFRTRSYAISDSYDRLHLNSVCLLPDGRLLCSLGMIVNEKYRLQTAVKTFLRKSNIWNIFLELNRKVRQLFGVQKKMLSELIVKPTSVHSAILSLNPDQSWNVHLKLPISQNPSHSIRFMEDGSLVYLETSSGHLCHFSQAGEMLSRTKVSDKFLRGLLVLKDGNLIFGASNDLIFYNLREKRIISELQLAENDQEFIFDIHTFPDQFDLPPASLHEKVGHILRYEGDKVVWG